MCPCDRPQGWAPRKSGGKGHGPPKCRNGAVSAGGCGLALGWRGAGGRRPGLLPSTQLRGQPTCSWAGGQAPCGLPGCVLHLSVRRVRRVPRGTGGRGGRLRVLQPPPRSSPRGSGVLPASPPLSQGRPGVSVPCSHPQLCQLSSRLREATQQGHSWSFPRAQRAGRPAPRRVLLTHVCGILRT